MPPIPDNLPVEITNRYAIVNNTFIGKNKGETHAELEVEIGDIHSDTFQPQFKIKRWDNECNFSVRLIDDAVDLPKLQTDQNKIKFIKSGIEAHFYDVPETDRMPEGYEFEIILKERPKTNKVQMSIETKGLVFYDQPEITQEEMEEGAFRPDNIVGSYAVYHKSKQGDYSKMGKKNYRAGKAFHIYRPRIIDNAGKEVWGKLNITNSILTVEIPQEFLDNAVYPVRHAAGLTFGYTNIGSTNVSWTANYVLGNYDAFSPASNGNLVSIWRYGKGDVASGNIKMCVYHGNDLVDDTNSDSFTTSPGWITTNVNASAAVSSANNYYIGSKHDVLFDYYYDSGGSGQYRYQSSAFADAFSDPISWSTSTAFNRIHSLYCTYTTGAAGGARPSKVFGGPFVGPLGGPIQ